MRLTLEQMTSGLTPAHDFVFPACPQNPDMRESSSVWLYDDKGRFAFPRVGIEAEAQSWAQRRVQGNFATSGGRVLDGSCLGTAHSPFDAAGNPTILGAGPIAFQCVEPFFTWRLTYDGTALDGTVEQQIAGKLGDAKRIAVKCDVILNMVTPAWVQDLTPETVAKMSPEDAIEAGNMGIGWRYEHQFRAVGSFEIDGQTHEFTGTGVHVKRQSVRPLAGFRGHVWQAALFPDGRAFGYITYPPRADGKSYNDGYIFQDGKMFPAKAVRIPWLGPIIGAGEDVSVELESELGITKITGVSAFNTFRVGNPELLGLNLNQGGALFTWDGQSAYGMMERSARPAPAQKP